MLFLDELPEFTPQALDSLRQPLETGEVAIARANHRIVYPARFQLVAAMNPCRCGHADDPGYACARGPVARCAAHYQARLSGPLLDRFDLTHRRRRRHRRRPDAAAAGRGLGEKSPRGSPRARALQVERFRKLGLDAIGCNAAAPPGVIEEIAAPDAAAAGAACARPPTGSGSPRAAIIAC